MDPLPRMRLGPGKVAKGFAGSNDRHARRVPMQAPDQSLAPLPPRWKPHLRPFVSLPICCLIVWWARLKGGQMPHHKPWGLPAVILMSRVLLCWERLVQPLLQVCEATGVQGACHAACKPPRACIWPACLWLDGGKKAVGNQHFSTQMYLLSAWNDKYVVCHSHRSARSHGMQYPTTDERRV